MISLATISKAVSLKGLVSLNTALILILSAWGLAHEGDRRAEVVHLTNMDRTLIRIEKDSKDRDENINRRLSNIERKIDNLTLKLVPDP